MLLALMLATAAPAVAAPSPAAKALAERAGLSIGFAAVPSFEDSARGIAQELPHARAAWQGPPCDRTDARCRAAADQVGREFAPRLTAWALARANILVALAADTHMTPGDMKAAETFLETPSGRHFTETLNALGDPKQANADVVKLLFGDIGPALPFESEAYFERFYALTADLPRGTHPVIAPPPAPPSRSPSHDQ